MHVIVVGGGVMGLSVARSLLARGHLVRLLDQNSIPNSRGASVDHHRLIRYTYGSSRGYTRMVADAFGAWDRLWTDFGRSYYKNTGTLIVGDLSDEWVTQSVKTLEQEGITFERIAHDIAERFPVLDQGLDEGLYVPEGGVLFASQIVGSLVELVRERGASVQTDCKVASLNGSSSTVQMVDGSIEEADMVIVAAGAWLPQLIPRYEGVIRPSRQLCLYLDPPKSVGDACRQMPMLINLDETDGFYAVPAVGSLPMKIGDHRFSLKGDPEQIRSVGMSEQEALKARLIGRIASPDEFRVSGALSCYYAVTEDERFMIEDRNGLLVLSGFSGHGFKFGPLIGERVAEYVSGELSMARLSSWAAGYL